MNDIRLYPPRLGHLLGFSEDQVAAAVTLKLLESGKFEVVKKMCR